MCLWLLDQCTQMWVCGDWQNSVGCNGEIEYCKKYDKPYRFLDEGML